MLKSRPKVRVTVSLDASVARQLDEQRKGRDLNRSEAVEEAIAEWVRRGVEQDRERVDGLGARVEAQADRVDRVARQAGEARIASGMVLEALRHQFRALEEVGDDELRRRAMAALSRRRDAKGGR